MLPNSLRSSIDPPKPVPGPHANGVVGSLSDSMSQLATQIGQLIITSQAPASASSSAKAPPLEKSTDVLMVKSIHPKNNQQSGSKNNNKRNKQKNQNSQESQPNP